MVDSSDKVILALVAALLVCVAVVGLATLAGVVLLLRRPQERPGLQRAPRSAKQPIGYRVPPTDDTRDSAAPRCGGDGECDANATTDPGAGSR